VIADSKLAKVAAVVSKVEVAAGSRAVAGDSRAAEVASAKAGEEGNREVDSAKTMSSEVVSAKVDKKVDRSPGVGEKAGGRSKS